MFKQLFAQGQEFTYGLKEAGSYYNSYVKLMDHWDKVLPGKVLRVNNEDAVAAVIRRTCRFRPSVMIISTQLVGIALRSLIGGLRVQRVGS